MFHVLIITKYNGYAVSTNVVECTTRAKAEDVITSVRTMPKDQYPTGVQVSAHTLYMPGGDD